MPPLHQTCERLEPHITCRPRADAERAGTFWRGEGPTWYWMREHRISVWRTCPWCTRDLPDQPRVTPSDHPDGYTGEDGG